MYVCMCECVRACMHVCVCVCVSTSVGAMRAPCQPEPAAASRASMATAVLPEPTSPCSRRIMGAGPCMSLSICTPHKGSDFRIEEPTCMLLKICTPQEGLVSRVYGWTLHLPQDPHTSKGGSEVLGLRDKPCMFLKICKAREGLRFEAES